MDGDAGLVNFLDSNNGALKKYTKNHSCSGSALCSCCPVAVSVLCLFLVVQWFGIRSMVVASTGQTHLLLECECACV